LELNCSGLFINKEGVHQNATLRTLSSELSRFFRSTEDWLWAKPTCDSQAISSLAWSKTHAASLNKSKLQIAKSGLPE